MTMSQNARAVELQITVKMATLPTSLTTSQIITLILIIIIMWPRVKLRILLKTSTLLLSITISNQPLNILKRRLLHSISQTSKPCKSKVHSHSNHINLALIRSNSDKFLFRDTNLPCQWLNRSRMKTVKTSLSITRLTQLMVASKSQGNLNSQQATGHSEAQTNKDLRAEEEDMQLKTSSTKQWLKLFKERIEKFNHLLEQGDKCTKPKISTNNNSLLQLINSIRPQRSKNSLLMEMSSWTLKKAVHSLSIIQSMQHQHHSTLMRTFPWETTDHQQETQASSHSELWHLQWKLDSECNKWKNTTNQTLLNSDHLRKSILTSTTANQLPHQGNHLLSHLLKVLLKIHSTSKFPLSTQRLS